MAFDKSLGNSLLYTLMGGLIEPSEGGIPNPPYNAAQSVAPEQVQTQHPAHSKESAPGTMHANWLVWGGLAIGLVVVIALIILIVKE